MSRRTRLHTAARMAVAGGLGLSALAAHGQVVTDGSLGPADALAGPNYAVPASLGRTVGTNLFHSFTRFDVPAGGSATFSGPASVANVLARVTGGSLSRIDGALRCTIPGADLFLINPAGVVFGPDAALDVSGSFAVTTADAVKLADGGRFDARRPAADSLLTTAPPSAFGFLAPRPAAVEVAGEARFDPAQNLIPAPDLAVAPGKSILLVGGDVRLSSGRLLAPGGRVLLASVASPGDLAADGLLDGGDAPPDVTRFGELGTVGLDRAAVVDASGPRGGRVDVVAGRVRVDTFSDVFADTVTGAGRGIRVAARGDAAFGQGTRVFADSSGPGRGGDVVIEAGGTLALGEGAVIAAQAGAAGGGGDVVIDAAVAVLDGGSNVRTRTSGAGAGGDVVIRGGSLQLTGGSQVGVITAGAGGPSGRVRVSSANVRLTDRGAIISGGAGAAFGGVAIDADVLIVDGDATGIDTSTSSSEPAGTIDVSARAVTLTGGASLTTSTLSTQPGAGRAGNIVVRAGTLRMDGRSTLAAETFGDAAAGDIQADVGELTMDGRSVISTSAKTVPGAAGAFPSGPAGNVALRVDTLAMNGLAKVIASAVGESAAGDVAVRGRGDDPAAVARVLSMRGEPAAEDFTEISTRTQGSGDAGDVDIRAAVVSLAADADVNAQTSLPAAGAGAGGTVVVRAETLHLDTDAQISSETRGSGAGGSIDLVATREAIFTRGGKVISRSSGTGAGGSLRVEAPRVLLDGGAVVNAAALGEGPGGRVDLLGGDLEVSDNSFVVVGTAGQGGGGSLVVDADRLTVDHSTVSSQTFGAGPAGNLTLSVPEIVLRNESVIGLDSVAGTAGNLEVAATTLDVLDSLIDASTMGSGAGGNVKVTATGPVRLDAPPNDAEDVGFEGIITVAGGADVPAGRGGDITIRAESLDVVGGATVVASTFGPGRAGNIDVRVRGELVIDPGPADQTFGARVSSQSNSLEWNAGPGGDVSVRGQRVVLRRGALITTRADRADAGDVTVSVGERLTLRDADVTTSAFGSGGNVFVNAPGDDAADGRGAGAARATEAVVLQRGRIVAKAFAGSGGNIRIASAALLQDPASEIDASSELGVAGAVDLTAPETDLIGGLARLPAGLADPSARLAELCGLGAAGQISSFVTTGRGGSPATPGAWAPSLDPAGPARRARDR